MILLCPPEKSTQFHYPLDPKKIHAEGSMHKDTTYQGSDRQDFYRHGKKTKQNKNRKKTRPFVRVHWVACGTCSVPGNFFQVGVCSRYNVRSDWLIVTGPRTDYGLAKTNQKVIQKPYNKLLTNRASSSRTGEYWP